MRALPAALLVSFALHGAAIAWVRLAPGDVKELPPVAPVAVEIVPAAAVSPEPMVVALLDDHTVVTAALRGSTKSPVSPKLAASTRVEPETRFVQPPVTTPEPPHNPWMSMRQPDHGARPTIDNGPSSTFLDHFVASSRPLAPKDIASEAIADELANAEDRLKNPRWVASASPDQVTAARMAAAGARDELANHELKPDGAGTKSNHEPFKISYDADGTAHIHDKPNLVVHSPFYATFDVTDWQMRKHGVDPYASYKLKVLDQTRDERVAIGKRYRTQQLARTPEYVQKNLATVWATLTDPAARRQALFELWDDCAEGAADDANEDELSVAGHTARAHIVGFIRSKLPEGSAGAFTSDDLARLNRSRRSHETFAPY